MVYKWIGIFAAMACLSGCTNPGSNYAISKIENARVIPYDWLSIIIDAESRFSKLNLNRECHSIVISSEDNENYIEFIPKDAFESQDFGISSKHSGCGPGVYYIYDSQGNYLRYAYIR